MNTYLITYDLGEPESRDDYQAVINHIKGSFSSWAKPLYSVWLVNTSKTASQIRDELGRVVDNNDKVLVMEVSQKAWATLRISGEVTNWMKTNI